MGVDVRYMPGYQISHEDVKDADALIVRTRTNCNENLLKGSTVKMVATATIGTDHIDIPWCESKGIIVKNAPGCNAPGVAQYVFASLFKTGFEPEKDKLGIIGYGNVGRIVAEWAKRLGIKTIINDPPRKEMGFKDVDYKSLEEVLKSSDAVTLHVPFTSTGKYPTYKLIGGKELAHMKPNAFLVNSSRGGVVDEKSLKPVLGNGKIKAIIDVWENEPHLDREIVSLASIATPHIAGYSAEGKMRATLMSLENIRDFFGIQVDLAGLECNDSKDSVISREMIENSYNPKSDSIKLKENPESFEALRNEYNYRHEPLFI